MGGDTERGAADTSAPRRAVRSFVRRAGRITRAQQRALDDLWPRYGVADGDDMLDFAVLFGRRAPVILDIGFGNGEATAVIAAAHPQHDYLGIEVHRPGIGALLLRLEQQDIHNVRIQCGDAAELLARRIPDASLDGVYLFFPDPWPKKRHHKRRLLQPGFAALVAAKLKPGGILHMATDWQDYAEHALRVLSDTAALENTAAGYAPRPDYRPPTRFERRGQRLGHGVWDLRFRRR